VAWPLDGRPPVIVGLQHVGGTSASASNARRPPSAALAGRPAAGRFCQDGGLHLQARDRLAQQAGTNHSTLAWATTVTDATRRRSDLTWVGQWALTPEGATMATDADDREQQQPEPQQDHLLPSHPEQQQRELEELRRQFAEVGKRISAFAPASTDEHRERPLALVPRITPPDQQPAPPDQQPAPPRWQWVAAVALLLVGTGFGYALPRAGSNHTPPPPAAARPPLSTQPQQPQPVPSVPQVCLETARRADEMVHLFTINDRSRRLVEALKAYTLASQACRQQASP
jgi:hypothetical protein